MADPNAPQRDLGGDRDRAGDVHPGVGDRGVGDLSTADDAALMRRHADGDAEAFAEIVRRHRDRLWGVALRTLGDREEAADALQDALLSAYRASGPGSGYRGDARVTTWLHRVVVNACLDRVRRRSARPASPLGDAETEIPDSVDTLGRRETALVVSDALATLPIEQRAALVLVDMQGYSVDEAAEMLDCAPGTVKSRCSRGRARLLPLVASLRSGGGADPVPGNGRAGDDPAAEGGAGNRAGSGHVPSPKGPDPADPRGAGSPDTSARHTAGRAASSPQDVERAEHPDPRDDRDAAERRAR